MNYTAPFTRTFTLCLSILSVLNLSLSAQPAEEVVTDCPQQCCSDYVYYSTEESNRMGGQRVAVIAGSAIIAGVVIGAIAISLASKHHKGSGSAHYSEIYSEINPDSYDSYNSGSSYSGYSGSSFWDSNYSDEYYSKEFKDKEMEIDVIKESRSNRSRTQDTNRSLTFSIGVEGKTGSITAVPYVAAPDGTVIEGIPQTIQSPAVFPDITIARPEKGTYHVGLKVLSPSHTLPHAAVKVIDGRDKVTELQSDTLELCFDY